MSPKLNVVLVTGSLGPGAGGLASAVRAWADGLTEAGVQVSIFCLDLSTTMGKNQPPNHPDIKITEVPCLIEPRTRLILAPGLTRRLQQYCVENEINIIHAHGVWLPGTRIAARVARRLKLPYMVSPHGHIQPWAMAHRRFKKRLAWEIYGRQSLARATLIQAASVQEQASVRTLDVNTPVALIPNIVRLPASWPSPHISSDTRKTALFFSRLHPSKGLLDLVNAWDRLRPLGWRVVVAGPDEAGHLAVVKRAVAQRKLNNDFEFAGPIPHEQRWSWYRSADLFVLPTYSENFGVTVAEALGAGVPVVTTRAAPWAAVAERGCGWWIDTGPDALQAALQKAFALDNESRAMMGKRGHFLVVENYSAPAVTQSLLTAYDWMYKGGTAPDFISNTGYRE